VEESEYLMININGLEFWDEELIDPESSLITFLETNFSSLVLNFQTFRMKQHGIISVTFFKLFNIFRGKMGRQAEKWISALNTNGEATMGT
jgi:hypothetical protein